MELEGIICGEGHQEAPAKVVWERIAVVVQKQGVVAQRRHGNTHLGQIVEVLHCGHLDVTEGSDMNNNYEHQNNSLLIIQHFSPFKYKQKLLLCITVCRGFISVGH